MKNINIISESFNISKNKIKPQKKVSEFMDSVAMIMLITNVEEKYSKTLDDKKLANAIYFKDVDDLIESTIKNKYIS